MQFNPLMTKFKFQLLFLQSSTSQQNSKRSDFMLKMHIINAENSFTA